MKTAGAWIAGIGALIAAVSLAVSAGITAEIARADAIALANAISCNPFLQECGSFYDPSSKQAAAVVWSFVSWSGVFLLVLGLIIVFVGSRAENRSLVADQAGPGIELKSSKIIKRARFCITCGNEIHGKFCSNCGLEASAGS